MGARGSGNHENDQVADHLDHAQRVSGEQLYCMLSKETVTGHLPCHCYDFMVAYNLTIFDDVPDHLQMIT